MPVKSDGASIFGGSGRRVPRRPLQARTLARPGACRRNGVRREQDRPISARIFARRSFPLSTFGSKTCVAPSFSARSRRYLIGSTPMIVLAPWMRAPCAALIPMGPRPKIATSAPASMGKRHIARPRPVPPTQASTDDSTGDTFVNSGTIQSSSETINSPYPPVHRGPPSCRRASCPPSSHSESQAAACCRGRRGRQGSSRTRRSSASSRSSPGRRLSRA